jgi:DNA-binding transcriptional MerR regulator
VADRVRIGSAYNDLMTLSIGQLAAATRERVKTLRFWSDLGLLTAERGSNGYRYYDPGMARRVAFIRGTQELGFSLDDIRGILDLRKEGLQPCDEVRENLQAHLSAVRTRITELQALEGELSARLTWAQAHPDPKCDEGCVYLTEQPN